MNSLSSILLKLPVCVSDPIKTLPNEIINNLEEIRIQIDQPVRIKTSSREIVVNSSGLINKEMMNSVISNLLDHSIYAYEEELAKGYITIQGGHRVGVCGTVINENGAARLIKDYSSLNIRRSQEFKGFGEVVINKITDTKGGLHNSIIVSPPKCGKTTLLRDIIRILSIKGFRVGVCDERSEIAGMYQGISSYDLGPRTDVLDRCNKAEGMMMLIRSMAPDVIATDEIGRIEDADAIRYALTTGIKVITTIHGDSYEDLINSQIGDLVKERVFERIIFLTNVPSTGTVREVKYV